MLAIFPHSVKIVLLGGRWGGKSSTANTILGEERFDSGKQRTAKSDNRHAVVAGRSLIIVDTPGWKGYSSFRETTEEDKKEIKRSVCECFPGPHAFLLVIPVDAGFTKDHKRSLEYHMELLGDRVWKHSIVLFTCGDWLAGRTIKQHIEGEWTEITIVDTAGWWRGYSVKDTTQLVKQEVMLSVSLCPPGPHVFLLAIDTDVRFTEKQRTAVEEHLQLIGDHVWSHTMILFSRADWMGARSIEQHIEEEGRALQWLVEKCGNRYHAIDNKSRDNGTQVTELLQKMKLMVAGNKGRYYKPDKKVLQSLKERGKEVEEKAKQRRTKVKEQREKLQDHATYLPEVRIVLMGQKSSGKNATGSTILDREAFPTCETVMCEKEEDEVAGRRVIVVNSPGWWENLVRCTEDQVKEIIRSLTLCLPGPHAILLVIPVDVAYTETHRRALHDHVYCLGEEIWRHTIVLFTYGDRLGDTTIEQHIEREGRALQGLVGKCGNRYHVFTNKKRGSGGQVRELLEKIEEMVAENAGKHFSPDMSQAYQQVEEKFKRREEEEIKLRFVEEVNREIGEMKGWFQIEWKRREKELLERFKVSLMELKKETGEAELPPNLKSKHTLTPNISGETTGAGKRRGMKSGSLSVRTTTTTGEDSGVNSDLHSVLEQEAESPDS
ncbi:hypothetical protein JZ751_021943 [Albula glossodonta]|uniref:AIG1-type G domain-containing protein n=1 Tax=Albula glossodonta TaxID=121402 RepID=A0A8T2MR13_9TELE|nr:hypothetical protein JZ751_021943 [Albula glossodonta]